MPASPSSTLVNLVGFLTGSSLYAMLFVMALRKPPTLLGPRAGKPAETPVRDVLPLVTACLGLIWNLGSLVVHGVQDFGLGQPSGWVVAGTYAALGFLPAVVVHLALVVHDLEGQWPWAGGVRWAAYGLSCGAGILQGRAAWLGQSFPAAAALTVLTIGFGLVMTVLLWATRRESSRRRVVWVVALAVFAVSALHLSQAHHEQESWWTALVGHHASIPLAFAILYEDYRFALADIFLKRALTLVVFIGIVAGLSFTVIFPLWGIPGQPVSPSVLDISVLWGCWMASSMAYPALQRACSWFVDRVILHRPDYTRLVSEVADMAGRQSDPDRLFQVLSDILSQALTARTVTVLDSGHDAPNAGQVPGSDCLHLCEDHPLSPNRFQGPPRFRLPGPAQNVFLPKLSRKFTAIPLVPTLPASDVEALILIPTVDAPNFLLVVGGLSGGRRLLSDDVAMLEAVAVLAARRIDALRVNHERCQQDLRTQELSKLAAEAELQTLRAQINPHFLFNALTTIGYLIQTSPHRALETLLRLTSLLRGVLRSSGEFSTLGEELDLIESYLMIERARFEERLRVTIDVPAELRACRIPALLIQPLVENAVKHGIAPHQTGGEVRLTACLETGSPVPSAREPLLQVTVHDTGAGVSKFTLARQRKQGVGLANVERRLHGYFGPEASLLFESRPGAGTQVTLVFPVPAEAHLFASSGIRRNSL